MTRRPSILVFVLLLGACSAPDDSKPDGGTTPDMDADMGVATQSVPPEGLYEGSADDDDAALAVWNSTDNAEGRLLVGDNVGFTIQFGVAPTLAPLDGACEACAAGPWDLIVDDASSELRISVVPTDVGPGFDDLIMVPSDGFKPEFAPGEEFDVWVGDFFAVAPAVSPAVLKSQCALSVNRETEQIESFGCESLDTDSAWTAEVPHSWRPGFFETEAATFVGEFGDDPNYETFNGQILIVDEVVGVFEMVKLN